MNFELKRIIYQLLIISLLTHISSLNAQPATIVSKVYECVAAEPPDVTLTGVYYKIDDNWEDMCDSIHRGYCEDYGNADNSKGEFVKKLSDSEGGSLIICKFQWSPEEGVTFKLRGQHSFRKIYHACYSNGEYYSNSIRHTDQVTRDQNKGKWCQRLDAKNRWVSPTGSTERHCKSKDDCGDFIAKEGQDIVAVSDGRITRIALLCEQGPHEVEILTDGGYTVTLKYFDLNPAFRLGSSVKAEQIIGQFTENTCPEHLNEDSLIYVTVLYQGKYLNPFLLIK